MIAIFNPLSIKKTTLPLLLMFCYTIMLAGQNEGTAIRDSLRLKSYEEFNQSFFKARKDKLKALIYATAWLRKAKTENNAAQMALAYKAFSYNCGTEKLKFVYIDSMVSAANQSKNNAIIGAAYLTKGIALYENMQHQKALDNYMIADAYLSKTADKYQEFKVKYQIAQTKYQLGFYNEAIALLRECIPYFEMENDRAYLNSLYALGLCYNATANYEASSQTNSTGQVAAKELQLSELLPYFSLSEALNEYRRKNYRQVIKTITAILPAFTSNPDKSNLAVAHFYLAKSYWDLGEKEAALPYLKKVVAVFNEQKYIRPDLLESYELLIEYYKATGDTKAQLYYMEELMTAEKKITQDFKYLSGKILRKYNTQKLRQEMQAINQSSYTQKVYGTGIIVSLSGTIVFLFYRHRKTRKQYRLKFEALMKKNKAANLNITLAPVPYSECELGFSQELATALLTKLERFEKRHEYTESDMNLSKLAAKLNTNQKYVTKILAHYRGKGIIEYISDLKIDYIVEKLQTDKKFRLYKNKSLSDEAGFGSTQIFTRTFKAKIGMPPTIFINELISLENQSQS